MPDSDIAVAFDERLKPCACFELLQSPKSSPALEFEALEWNRESIWPNQRNDSSRGFSGWTLKSISAVQFRSVKQYAGAKWC